MNASEISTIPLIPVIARLELRMRERLALYILVELWTQHATMRKGSTGDMYKAYEISYEDLARCMNGRAAGARSAVAVLCHHKLIERIFGRPQRFCYTITALAKGESR